MQKIRKVMYIGTMVIAMVLSVITIPNGSRVSAEDNVEPQSGDVWRHFAAGAGNDNGNNPALLKNSDANIDQLVDGTLSFTFRPLSTKTDTRFGVYLRYLDASNFVYVGVDASSNWFYEYKVEGQGSFPKLNIEGPQQGEDAKLHMSWVGNDLTITINGELIGTYPIEALTTLQDAPLRIRAGQWGTASTDVLIKDVFAADRDGNIFAEGGNDKWEVVSTGGNEVYEPEYIIPEIHYVNVDGIVVDEDGNPVDGATIALDTFQATTDATGAFTISDVPSGTYTAVVSKIGFKNSTTTLEVGSQNLTLPTITLEKEAGIEVEYPAYIESTEMKVGIDNTFPRAIVYEMKNELAGEKFYGQTEVLDHIKINGVNVVPTTTFSQTGDTATYVMRVLDEANDIDATIHAQLVVEGNELTFKVTSVEDTKIVKTIEIENHGLISIRNTQSTANFAGMNMSVNTHKSGDVFKTVDEMTTGKAGYMYGFLSTSSLSAGIWSNSENNVTSDWQRITSQTVQKDDYKVIGLSSTYWTHQKGAEYRKENTVDELPVVKVVITGDLNDDAKMDWQDGAIAYRDIMEDPQGAEVVPDSVAIRIAMNFGSQAQNPFLMTLDNVKKVNLHTDGLGQSILLKGYGSEGHDSGHLDYADIGTRIGGAEDMKFLLAEGKKYGANFGVHVNASETYPESQYFDEARLKRNANGSYSYGWNWLDQGVNIDANYDMLNGRADRFRDFYNALGGAENDLDFIYVDVWGNGQSGDNGTWASSQLAKEINNLDWRVAGEWGYAFAYDSTFQHWAADLTYGGYSLKGINSSIARFIQNHQRDSWVGDYPSYGGAAKNPLLGGYDMKDFEGWQGRNDYNGYMENLFDDNLSTKFLQHFKVTNWENGNPVTMNDNGGSYTWIPEMKITLKDDTHTITVERQSNDVNSAGYSLRTMTYDGKVVMDGEKYLLPWNWDENGNTLSSIDEKLYHWNQAGGTSTWNVPAGWSGNVLMYTLSEDGKQNEQTIPIVNGKVTLTAQAKTAYVLHKTSVSNEEVVWSEGGHIVDTGFNGGTLDAWTLDGDPLDASIVLSEASNRMLALGNSVSEVSVSQTLTDLTPGQQYAVYVGVDNRSEKNAYLEIDVNGETISNYTGKSVAKNYVQAYAHNTNSPTVGGTSYFQNMYVFFTAPTDGTDVTLRLRRDSGIGLTYFDDIRIFENESNMTVSETRFEQDFENVPQGIFPFVIGSAEGVQDNRTHLSQLHEPYTQRGWNDKKVNDVIEGEWSLKTNGLTQRSKMIYQTIPQNYRFEAGEMYKVTFQYEAGSTGTYGVVVGDGEVGKNPTYIPLEETISKEGPQTYSIRIKGSDTGQTWVGIYSTNVAPDTEGTVGGDANFRGYKDLMLDNVVIEKSIASKDELLALVEANANLFEENYSTSSWAIFIEEMEHAQVVLDDPNATQEVVDAATASLQEAIDGLELTGSVVHGKATDAMGTALADITITIKGDGGDFTTVTDASGNYRVIGVTFGTYSIQAESKYFNANNATITTSATSPSVEKNFLLLRGRANVSGVVSAVGLPIDSAMILFSGGAGFAQATSGADGQYKVDNLFAGEYTVYATSMGEGYDTYISKISIEKDSQTIKNIMFEPLSTYDYTNNFDDGTTTWQDLAGNTSSTVIKAEDGGTTIKFPGGHANVYDTSAPRFMNGSVEMDVTAIKDSARFGILLRANDMNNRVYVGTLDNANTWFTEYWGKNGNSWSGGIMGPGIMANTTVHLKAEIVNKTIKLWVDGSLVLENTMDGVQLDVGSIGLNTRNNNEVKVDNVKVTVYDAPEGEVNTAVGRVTNAGQIAENVTVEISQKNEARNAQTVATKSTETDFNGNYKFKNLPYGEYVVSSTVDGETITKDVVIKETDGYIVVDPLTFNEPATPLDKAALLAAIEDANLLTADGYTAQTWEAFEAALEAAKVVYDDPDATAFEVNNARTLLVSAQESLLEISKDELGALIVQAEALEKEMYSAESFTILEEALTQAKQVMDNPSATEADVEAAVTALSNAIAQLEKINKDELLSLIEIVEGLQSGQYTEESWAALVQALEEAKGVYDNVAATQAEIDAAIQGLKAAITGLEEIVVIVPDPGTEEPLVKDDNAKTAVIRNVGIYGGSLLLAAGLLGWVAYRKKKEMKQN